MAIPDFQSVMRPTLTFLADGQVHASREAIAAMADVFELTPQERDERLGSGQTVIYNRVSWALTYLSQAGLIERPARGRVRITQAGQEALERHPERIDMKVLEDYPGYRAFKERTKPSADTGSETQVSADASATPQELIQSAEAQNRAALQSEILTRALALSPTGFEDLVMQLLGRMGYGRLGDVTRTSATGDAGVDGIISQDPLGLDRIYVQAKRYATDRTVDRPRIHEFAGALLGKQGDRGVFITTATFSAGAIAEAERLNARIELINGTRLAELLVQYEVGVQAETRAILYRVDEDFFDGIS